MTAVAADPTPTIDISSTPRVPFGRLVALALGITLLVVALNDGARPSATEFSQIMTIPVSLLVPVLAITSITSEWSQRTGLVSFTLEPHRMRVVWAKFVTVLILAAATLVLAIAFAFGLVFLSTPASIAIYYIVAMLLPFMVYGTLYAIFDWAKDVIPWI